MRLVTTVGSMLTAFVWAVVIQHFMEASAGLEFVVVLAGAAVIGVLFGLIGAALDG